jgi:Flp pilus assembly protein TadB
VLGYPLLPGFFVLCAAAGVVSAFVAHVSMSLIGTGMLAVGALVYRWRVGSTGR